MVGIYTNLGITPLWLAILVNVVLFMGITSRMISASALMTAVPLPPDRGAFMSINSSVQQISGGIASAAAGMIVVQSAAGTILHFDILGYVVIASMVITIRLMYVLNRQVQRNTSQATEPVLQH
ncbi:MAG: hypothetical protein H7Y03_09510 [Chitinophagaceae bacterium]|nr:hypothetical protein [Chitinophagaceae bacterium]